MAETSPRPGSGRRPLRWLLVLAWMGLIFAMSAQTQSGAHSRTITEVAYQLVGVHPSPQQLDSSDHLLRKASHLTEYAILASLLWWALPARTGRFALLAWLFATMYAASDEIHQIFVPLRGPSVADVGIDSCGAGLGLLVGRLARRLRR